METVIILEQYLPFCIGCLWCCATNFSNAAGRKQKGLCKDDGFTRRPMSSAVSRCKVSFFLSVYGAVCMFLPVQMTGKETQKHYCITKHEKRHKQHKLVPLEEEVPVKILSRNCKTGLARLVTPKTSSSRICRADQTITFLKWMYSWLCGVSFITDIPRKRKI